MGKPTAPSTYEELLQQDDERFRELAELLPDIVYEFNMQGEMVFVNGQSAKVSGYTPEEFRNGLHALTLVDPADRARAADNIRRIIQGENLGPSQYKARRKDGSTFIGEARSAPVYRDGKVVGLRGVVVDITQHKETEAALRSSQERFKELARLLPEIVFEMNREGVLTFVNEQAYEMMGYTAEDFAAGLKAVDFIAPADRRRAAENIKDIMSSRKAGFNEYVVVRKDGSMFPVITHSVPITREGGCEGLRGIMVDITERKQAEAALRSSEERFKRLAELLPEIVYEMDETGRLTFVNPRAYEMTGYSRQDFEEGLGPMDFLAPEDRGRAARNINKIASGERLPINEYTIIRKDGSAVPVIVRSAPIVREGRSAGLRGIIVDITDRKNAEEALRESEEKYHSVFNAANDAIFVLEIGSWRIIDANQKATEMLGYSAEEFAGLKVADADPFGNTEEVLRERGASAIEGNPQVFEHMARHKSGRLFPVEVNLRKAVIAGQDRFISVVRDITERKQIEEQLLHSQKMEAVGRLAGGVAHDFNNLLTAIIGYSEVLLNRLDESDSMREPLTQIRDAGHRAASLTRQLQAFGRKQVLDIKATDLNCVISELQDMIRTLLGAKISLEITLDPQGVFAKIDPGQIEHVILNLSLNARDAMPGGGRLIVQTLNQWGEYPGTSVADALQAGLSPEDYVMFSVTDTGHGIDEETRSRIFEPFFSTKEKSKGTGLGLSMVYGIVEQHGGHIEVDSAPGRGAAFRIYLPRALKDENLTTPTWSGAAQQGSSETVLLVEDEDVVRNLAGTLLEQSGYRVLSASTPSQAGKISGEHDGPIDLLVTDVVMPEMDGPSLFGLLSKERPKMKVLFVSGYTENAHLSALEFEQHAEFLQKPFSASALARKVREALDQGT